MAKRSPSAVRWCWWCQSSGCCPAPVQRRRGQLSKGTRTKTHELSKPPGWGARALPSCTALCVTPWVEHAPLCFSGGCGTAMGAQQQKSNWTKRRVERRGGHRLEESTEHGAPVRKCCTLTCHGSRAARAWRLRTAAPPPPDSPPASKRAHSTCCRSSETHARKRWP